MSANWAVYTYMETDGWSTPEYSLYCHCYVLYNVLVVVALVAYGCQMWAAVMMFVLISVE